MEGTASLLEEHSTLTSLGRLLEILRNEEASGRWDGTGEAKDILPTITEVAARMGVEWCRRLPPSASAHYERVLGQYQGHITAMEKESHALQP